MATTGILATYHGYNTIINNDYLCVSMEKARETDLLLSEKEGGKAKHYKLEILQDYSDNQQ